MSLRLILWNVQHGSAAYIHTPNGKHIAIDLGAGDAFSPLQHLWRNGVQMTEGEVREGNPKPSQETEAKLRKYFEVRRRYNSTVDPQDDVDLPQNNGGVSIRTFVPRQSATGNLNNHSVVTVLEYSGVKVLIPGDNESASWEELLNRDDFVAAITGTHVLVASHHGRESGFHSPLFDHFTPTITLISDGRTVDTSATSRYTNVTKGWSVRRKNGTSQDRKCVTTRNDGTIDVTINSGHPIGSLDVLID